MRYHLTARVDTDDPGTLAPVLEEMARRNGWAVRRTAQEFELTGECDGESARELNRRLLSDLRRAVKKTRLRSEWSAGGTAQRFFDYVPKGTRPVGPRP